MNTEVSIVVAMNQERVIGTNNQLPWHIPEDLAYFKEVTLGKPVIMGRKTFESIGRILPGRKNIVITRNHDFSHQHQGITTYSNLTDAINANCDVPELCIIGGGEIFKLGITLATQLYLTVVDCPVTNPCAWFPKVDLVHWQLLNHREIVSKSGISCSFNHYVRKHS